MTFSYRTCRGSSDETVEVNNDRMAEFPDPNVAGLTGFKEGTLLQFSDEQKQDVNVQNRFRS